MATIHISVTDTTPVEISLWAIVNNDSDSYFTFGNDISSLMKYVATHPSSYMIPRLPGLLDAFSTYIDTYHIMCVSNELGNFAVRLLNPETNLHTISIFFLSKIEQLEESFMNEFNLLVNSDATDPDIEEATRAIKTLFQYDKVNVYHMDVTLPTFAVDKNTVFAMNFQKEKERNENQY